MAFDIFSSSVACDAGSRPAIYQSGAWVESGAPPAPGALARDRRSPRFRPLRVAVDAGVLVYDENGVHPVRLRNLSRCGVESVILADEGTAMRAAVA